MRTLILLLCLFLPAMAGAQTGSTGIRSIGAPALPADFKAFPWVNPDAPKGGEVRLASIGSFDSFNPFIVRGTPAMPVERVWDTLLQVNPDEPAAAYGLLAKDVQIAPDRMWVAFDLRPEARFHDNTPVTADDVVWTFQSLRDQGRPFFRAYYADVADAVAEGPERVVFHFKSNQNRELPLILGEMPVLPKHWWQGRDFSKPLSDPPLGSGPYRVGQVDMGRTLTMERVPDYWAANLPVARGLNNFDRITTEYFRDSTVAMEAFKAGQIDFREENISKTWATGYDFPAVQKGLVKKEEIHHQLDTGMQGFAMNLRRPIFANRQVRQALAIAFDFEWMNKNLFYGAYTRTLSYFSNSQLAATGLPQGDELALLEPYRAQLPPELFTTPYALPITDGSGTNRAQLRQALGLLKQAGWDVKQRKLVDASGNQMKFTILLPDPSYERATLPYVQSLDKLGIAADVRTVDPSQYQHLIDNFDYDMTMITLPEGDVPGNEQRDYWSCDAAKSQGSSNVMGICSPAVDALVEKIIAATDWKQLLAATHALDRVLLWGWYVVPNWHIDSNRIAYWDKFGRPDKTMRTGYDIDDWWIVPGREAALKAAQ